MRQWTLVFFLASSLLLTGCVSLTTQHTATPIPKGEVEFGVVPGMLGVGGEGSGVLPIVEFALRYGISDQMDFGVKLTGPTLTADLNYALINQENFALSLDPTVGVFYFSIEGSSFFWFQGSLPVLVDVVKTDSITLVTGAKLGYVYVSADSAGEDDVTGSGDGGTVGGTIGAKFRLSENFAIMPSFDIMLPFESFGDVMIYNVALGFHF